jgi:hypothetical protein
LAAPLASNTRLFIEHVPPRGAAIRRALPDGRRHPSIEVKTLVEKPIGV